MHKLPRSSALPLCLLATVALRAAAGTALALQSDLSHIQLGSTQEATIAVDSPVDLDSMEVSVSCGKVDQVRRVDARHFQARYVPPRQTFPQLAFLVAVGAVSGEPIRGWMALPLWGAGEAQLVARPRARVMLKVGETSYGPVFADSRGKVSVAIQVPPGVEFAFDGHKQIDLQLPPLSLHHAEVDRSSVAADQPQRLAVRVFAADERGRPRSHASIEWGATRGTVTSPVETEPGLYEGVWTLPAGKSGLAALEGRIAGEPAPELHLEVHCVAGNPARLEIAAQPSTHRAGSMVPVVVTVKMFDLTGNPATGNARLVSDVGKCEATQPPDAATSTFACQLGSNFSNRAASTLTARTDGAVARFRVALIPGAARQARFQHPAQLQPQERTPIQISLSDQFGNPTSDGPRPAVELSPGQLEPGQLEPVQDKGLGQYEVTVSVPRDSPALALNLHSGEVFAREELPVANWYPAWSFDLKGGWFTNGAEISAPLLAFTLGVWARPLGLRPWSIDVDLAVLRSERTVAETQPAATPFRATNTLMQGHVMLARSFAVSPLWRIQVGGGVGGSFVSSAASVAGTALPTQSAWSPSALVSASLRRRVGPGSALLELRTTAMADPHLDVWSGALIGFVGTVGYSLEL